MLIFFDLPYLPTMARMLLTRLEELCNVDVDDADSTFLEKLPLKPHNR